MKVAFMTENLYQFASSFSIIFYRRANRMIDRGDGTKEATSRRRSEETSKGGCDAKLLEWCARCLPFGRCPRRGRSDLRAGRDQDRRVLARDRRHRRCGRADEGRNRGGRRTCQRGGREARQ